ncbi:MAG: bifunctional hydroxymethylpyrimidine kinase/phosphomethylpyrimidine kinase, partial [Planctomycetaceae bacterium]|nr:bifunctional hydroxymethylpyrimidine kinase/phosphomethylpyrimidine kinase [Planctomycetaceae bacterium]
GKGANQAVAAARLGADVQMIGAVGDDLFGVRLRESLQEARVNCDHVSTISSSTSGVAVITVDDQGQNAITLVPGANRQLQPEHVLAAEQAIAAADLLLVQLEIPMDTVITALETATKHRIITVLDPAPAIKSVLPFLQFADVICPNETEAEELSGHEVHDASTAIEAARQILNLSPEAFHRTQRSVVVTMGKAGAVWCNSDGSSHQSKPFRVNAVDTTAAGDAFAAALGLELALGQSLADSIEFGCAAGAIAASRHGAQPSMPTRHDVTELLKTRRS